MPELEKIKGYILTPEEKAAVTAACMTTELEMMVKSIELGDTQASEIAKHLSTALTKIIALQKELETGVTVYERRMN